jgi:hypothetical protein
LSDGGMSRPLHAEVEPAHARKQADKAHGSP